jgi:ribosomal protein S18 acetylase RimI-like enzyme
VCFGPTPLTESTFDLYWIAVDKAKHRSGVGKKLLKFAEEEVMRRGGRLLLVETSSQETYGGTIAFYEKTGYDLVGKIKDYYKTGDDKLVFVKRLPASTPTPIVEDERSVPKQEAQTPVMSAG